MGQTLVIQPVSRIEGHAKISIQLDDAGNVADTRVNVIELRGFERFCVGKPVEEMPRITTRICGVCPWSHHLASAKTTDAVFGVEIPPAGEKLRRLCNSIAYMEEHILHFYILAGPDFVMGPETEYPTRNRWSRSGCSQTSCPGAAYVRKDAGDHRREIYPSGGSCTGRLQPPTTT